MPYFQLKSVPTAQDAQQPFVDRTVVNELSKIPRFAQLALRLQQYWQAGGDEILSLVDDSSHLIGQDMWQKMQAFYECALNQTPCPDACVLVAISDEPNPKILLTRRASRLGSHAGEMAFVGGKRDADDASSLVVALREAYEEVLMCAEQVNLIGYLPMQLSKNGLWVRPVVVQISSQTMENLQANPDEIAQIFWLPLSQVIQQAPIDYVFERRIADKIQRLHTPAWLLMHEQQTQVIWGLTGRILASLAKIGYQKSYPWYYRLR